MSVNEQKSGSWSEGTLCYMGKFKRHYNFETRVLLLSAYGETREKGQEGVLCWVARVSMF